MFPWPRNACLQPLWSPGLCERSRAKLAHGRAESSWLACDMFLTYCVVKELELGGLNKGQALHFSFLTWQPFRETLLSAIS